MDFHPRDRVVFKEKQLHGNASIMRDGQVISIEGTTAKVAFDGEIIPRTIPLTALSTAKATYGVSCLAPNEHQVHNAMRN